MHRAQRKKGRRISVNLTFFHSHICLGLITTTVYSRFSQTSSCLCSIQASPVRNRLMSSFSSQNQTYNFTVVPIAFKPANIKDMNLFTDTVQFYAWTMNSPSVPEHINIERANTSSNNRSSSSSSSRSNSNSNISEKLTTPAAWGVAATSKASHQATKGMVDSLPADFEPNPHSVILGRGKGCYNNPGNKRCRQIVQEHLEQYNGLANRFERATVVKQVFDTIKQSCQEGAFIKKASGRWCEVDDKTAREKLFTMFRDCQNSQLRRTSTTEKKKQPRRQKVQTQRKEEDGSSSDSAIDVLADISLNDLLAFNFSSKEEGEGMEEESVSSGCGSFYDVESKSLCSI